MSKPRTPANSTAKKARRVAIAKGLIQQKTTTQIASELGVGRPVIYRELQNPETQALIQSWMRPHHDSIKRMIPRALAAVNKGLKPSQEMRDRLNAVKTLGTIMEWSEGVRRDENDGKQLRWQGELTELIALYARVVKQGPA